MPRPNPVRWAMIAVTAVLLWTSYDLFGPRRVDIRVFDAAEVARLDTAMWRSYYAKQRVPLFLQLADLMRRQFHFPFARSYVVAFRAARAAYVFKGGHDRMEYERAIPDLKRYFGAIRAVSLTPFDADSTARLELEWWIVHRERDAVPSGALERALAAAAAQLYRTPVVAMRGYARERTVAMAIRDSTEAHGGVTERDWAAIEEHLDDAWRSLHDAVIPGSRTGG